MLHHMATILVCYGGHFDKSQKLGSNGEHSPKFTQQVLLEYQRWLAERFIIA